MPYGVLSNETLSTRLELEYKWNIVGKRVSVYYLAIVPVEHSLSVFDKEGANLFVVGRTIAKAKLAFPL